MPVRRVRSTTGGGGFVGIVRLRFARSENQSVELRENADGTRTVEIAGTVPHEQKLRAVRQAYASFRAGHHGDGWLAGVAAALSIGGAGRHSASTSHTTAAVTSPLGVVAAGSVTAAVGVGALFVSTDRPVEHERSPVVGAAPAAVVPDGDPGVLTPPVGLPVPRAVPLSERLTVPPTPPAVASAAPSTVPSPRASRPSTRTSDSDEGALIPAPRRSLDVPAVTEPVGEVVGGVTEPVGEAVGGVTEPVGEAVREVTAPVREVTDPVVDEVEEVTEPVVDEVEEVTEPVVDEVEEVTEPVTDEVEEVTEPILADVLGDA